MQQLPRKTLRGSGPRFRRGLEQFPPVGPEVSRTQVGVAGSRGGIQACAQRGVQLRVNNRGRTPGELPGAFPVRQLRPSTSPSSRHSRLGCLGGARSWGAWAPVRSRGARWPPCVGATQAPCETGGGARRAATSARATRAEPSLCSGDTAQSDSTPLGKEEEKGGESGISLQVETAS